MRTVLGALLMLSMACTSRYQLRGLQDTLPAMTLDAFVGDRLRQIDTEARSVEDFGDFKVGIVEVGEDGLVNPQQWQQVLRLAEKNTKHGGIIVTYVHGWHHDARACDPDLASFRRVLQEIANVQRGTVAKRNIVGIYIGWRAESTTHFPVNYLTFLSRKPIAEDVGRKGGAQVLSALHALWQRRNRDGRKVTMVTIGHSYGGAFLMSALKGSLTGEIADVIVPGTKEQQPGLRVVSTSEERKDGAKVKAKRASLGDLVVLLNPAIEATLYIPFDRDLRDERFKGPAKCPHAFTTQCPPEHELPYAKDQKPVLMVIASKADAAVRWVFPPSQWVTPWNGKTIYRASMSIGLGHFGPQVTHELTFTARDGSTLPIAKRRPCDLLLENVANADAVHPPLAGDHTLVYRDAVSGNEIGTLTLKVVPKRIADRGWDEHSPYMVIETDESVIRDHDDVFNPILTQFLIQFVAAYDETKSQVP